MSPDLLTQVTDDQIIRACEVERIDQAGLVCRNVFRWTESETLARLGDWLATRPLKIVLILLSAFVINRLVRRIIRKFIDSLSGEEVQAAGRRLRKLTPRALQSTTGQSSIRSAARAQTIGLVLKSAASFVVYSIAVLMAMSEVGLNLAPLIAGAGVVGVALGFGAQSLVRDFLSGLFMLAEDQYGVGDVVDVGEATGVVEAVNLRLTRLRSVDGTVWHVPNGEIRRVGNMSQQWARALLDIEVAYDTDLDRALEVVKEVADELWADDIWKTDIVEEPEVWGVQTLGASGITIRLVIKTQPGQQWVVTRELNKRMKARFDAEGIEIPFPQQVMWMRRDGGSSRETAAGDASDLEGPEPAAGS